MAKKRQKNPVAKNMARFTRGQIQEDRKKAAKKGYVKHKDRVYN